MSIKVIVAGVGGRMGKRIAQIISETGGITLSGGTEVKGSVLVGKDLGHLTGTGNNNINISDRMEEIINNGEVIIDFTTPAATMGNLKVTASKKNDLIMRTPALSNAH